LTFIKNTIFIGKVLLQHDSLASTNLYALNLVSKNNPTDGTVISTYNQADGRGQIGSKWESEPLKNISLSIILYPKFLSVRNQFRLNQAISLGVFDFITKYINKKLKVKWSNDIYVANAKIAGILIQNTLSGSNFQSSVVGIGINVNQAIFKSDAPNPISMFNVTGNKYDLDQLVGELCKSVEQRYLQLRAGNHQQLEDDYINHLYRYQEDALYKRMDDGTIFSGKIVGLTDLGKLLIDHNRGTEAFGFKEVAFLQND